MRAVQVALGNAVQLLHVQILYCLVLCSCTRSVEKKCVRKFPPTRLHQYMQLTTRRSMSRCSAEKSTLLVMQCQIFCSAHSGCHTTRGAFRAWHTAVERLRSVGVQRSAMWVSSTKLVIRHLPHSNGLTDSTASLA